MHELGMIRSAANVILDELRKSGGQHVTAVQLAVKASGHTTEESVRQLFSMASAGTPAAGAKVTIEWLPADFSCLSCLYRFTACQSGDKACCPVCGGDAVDLDHQDICFVNNIAVAFDDCDSAIPPADTAVHSVA